MIGLTLWVIIISYIAALVAVGFNVYPWKRKLAWWGVLLLPLAIWLWDWPIIKFHHEMACRREGGLKILIEPEKADRIQLDENTYQSDAYAEGLLRRLYPKLKVVEARDGYFGPGSPRYFSYSIDPDSIDGNHGNYKTIKKPIDRFTPDQYVLKRNSEQLLWHGEQRQVSLVRDDKIYAKSSWFRAIWNSSGMFPYEWQCGTSITSNDDLTKLILK